MQKTFINKRFDPKNFDEISDEKINDFVKNSLEEYPAYASMFGNNGDGAPPAGDEEGGQPNGSKDEVDQVVEDILK
jgi:hypothetical protein